MGTNEPSDRYGEGYEAALSDVEEWLHRCTKGPAASKDVTAEQRLVLQELNYEFNLEFMYTRRYEKEVPW